MKKSIFLIGFVLFLVIALTATTTWAFFTNTKSETLEMTTAKVLVGSTTGFPLQFFNLVPGVWTDFKQTTVNNASTIPIDLYFGLKHVSGNCDLIHPDVLTVDVQWWDGSSWQGIYYGGAEPLFASWHKVAEDMPAGHTWTYRTRVLLDVNVNNSYQDCWLSNTLFIHAVQWTGGSAPSTAPWQYIP